MIKRKVDDDILGYMDKVTEELEALRDRGIILVGSFPEGGPLDDKEFGPLNISALGDRGVQLIGRALSGGVFKSLHSAAVIDVDKAAGAYAALGTPYDNDAIKQSFLQGRIRLQGTDGVRGTVSLASEGDPVIYFGRTGQITPELIDTLCYSFGKLARRAGLVRDSLKVVVAQDGRDAATGGKLAAAMLNGLRSAGLTVVDLGVAPTPAVPFAQSYLDVPLGAVLTASHNPSSQNGIKFFINGFKLLPEGPVGDFALTSLAYATAHDGRRVTEPGSIEDGSAALDAFCDYIIANLPSGAADTLRGLDIVFDPANGAFTAIGKKVFAKLNLNVVSVNDNPLGHNINQGGGVAELEGRRRITAVEAKGSPALSSVSSMLEHASTSTRNLYGLVMDGDGDRGFLVASAAGGAEAHVSDGDAIGYILARYLRESKAIPDSQAGDYHYVSSVESDLTVFREASRKLGLQTDITCVGDKWLVSGFRAGRRLAIGEEVSGHVLWPTEALSASGAPVKVLTGNGLLTALSALTAAVRLGLSPEEMSRPFPEGAFVTRYTYNVDKALLFPGSHVWEEDLKVIGEALEGLKGSSFETWRLIEKPDEPEMLYVGLFDAAGALSGAVFVRNSGTENKTGVYARSEKSLEPLLGDLCHLVWKIHRRALKDRHSKGCIAETAALKALESGPLAKDELIGKIGAVAGEELTGEEIDAVLFGMRKEGLVAFQSGKIVALEG